ncbi:MAG: Lrp/AsnC family transcriptional regulator [Halanaerobiales bacterium]
MDKLRMDLLNIIQKDFPIDERPYKIIAEKLNIAEKDVLDLVIELKSEGYIRRFGGVFNSRKLGYSGTLCAAIVPESNVLETAKIINQYPEVTHNYLRNNKYNMWFTITAYSKVRVQSIFEEIKDKANLSNIIMLDSLRVFKLGVNFELKERTKND